MSATHTTHAGTKHPVKTKTAHTKIDSKPKKKEFQINMKVVDTFGRIGAVLSVIMYVSYVTQIANNLGGHPGTPWQPLAAFFNCTVWTFYGWFKPKKDWPIIVANIPGIFLGFITFITSLIQF